ncbi:MAG: tetratricopeptide repeat protein, partial [Elusimicrobiota bacterium]|nr:tetratricopeptide repeat protein [Elusimicrobiota bacterium]
EAQAKQAGKLLGADFVITGSMFKKTGGGLELNLRAIEVETGVVKTGAKIAIKEDWVDKFAELSEEEAAGNATFALCKSGIEALDRSDFEKAAGWFSKAIEAEEKGACGIDVPGLAYFGRSMAYKNQSGPDAAEEIPENPGYDFTLQEKDRIRSAAGEHDKAMLRYNALIKAMPDNAEAYYRRGIIFTERRQYRNAMKDYDAAIKLDAERPDYYYARGFTLSMLRLYDNATADFTASIKLNPGYSKPYTGRGIVYLTMKQYEKALKDYNKAIELEPGHVYYANRAVYYFEVRKYREAADDYTRAIALNPDMAEAYSGRGLSFSELNEYDAALKDFSKALELRPGLKEAVEGRAVVYDKKSGKYQKYTKDMRKTRELFEAADAE